MKLLPSRPRGGFFAPLIALFMAAVTPVFGATLLPPGKQTFINANGAPLALGTVTMYVPGTTTPKNTWQDAAQTVLNTNPVTLGPTGQAIIYGSGCYRQIVKDSSGNTIWDQPTCDTSSTSLIWAGHSGGTANSQTITASNFTSQDGQTIAFIAGLTNTGPLGLIVNGGGSINVVRDTASGPFSLAGGEVFAGNNVLVQYDATLGAFHLVNNPVSGSTPLTTLSGSGTTDLGAASSHFVQISGTATITSFGNTASTVFPFYTITFSGASTLTNSASLILPNAQNIVTQAGDYATAIYNGAGIWTVINYNSGLAPRVAGGLASGLSVTVGSNTSISIAISSITIPGLTAATTGRGIIRTGVALAAATGTSGIGGLDTGSIAASTWYHVWIIDNGTAPQLVLSTSSTTPTLPTGYLYGFRLGSVRTDGASALLRTVQKGNRTQYAVTAATNTAALPIMGSGTAGSLVGPGWIAVSTANYAPPTATRFSGIANQNGGQIMVAPNNSYGAYSSATNPPPVLMVGVGGAASTNISSVPFDFVLETANIYWASSTPAVLLAMGWADSVIAN